MRPKRDASQRYLSFPKFPSFDTDSSLSYVKSVIVSEKFSI